MVTLWAINTAPLQLGDDLTILDPFGIQLLTNPEVIAVDQSGVPGQVITESAEGGGTMVFAKTPGLGGDYYVALFNLNSTSSPVTVNWISLGFSGSAEVRDLWARSNVGSFTNSYTVTLNPYASSLLLVRPCGEGEGYR